MYHFERWRTAIQTAQTREDVCNVLTEYVRCLPAEEIKALPTPFCRALQDPTANVHSDALDLLQRELQYNGDDAARGLMHEISLSFTAASIRLAQLEGHQRHPHDLELFAAYENARRGP
jgi:hypothetical protein